MYIYYDLKLQVVKICWQDTPNEEETITMSKFNLPMRISGSYIRNGVVRIPLHTYVAFAGM